MGNPYPADVATADGDVRIGGEITFTDPDNQPGGGSQPGVWKTYGVDSTGLPLSGVTVGNGTLVGRWWTPAAVVPDPATDPFLCFLEIRLKLGSTSSIDDNIRILPPALVDASGNDIAILGDAIWVNALAYQGVDYRPGFAGGINTHEIYSMDGTTEWDATHPIVWAEGDVLVIQATFEAQFLAD